MDTEERPRFTPEALSELKKDEVFVFGSNLAGQHGGGAARAAVKRFGAIWGQGVGLQGQSYAIPTMQGGVSTIVPYVDQFIKFAKEHTELFFYVTRIGCGIAGFRDEEIAPLFCKAIVLDNVCLPESFVEVISRKTHLCYGEKFNELLNYSSFRMLVDMVQELNEVKHYTNKQQLTEDLSRIICREGRRGMMRYFDLFYMSNPLFGRDYDVESTSLRMIIALTSGMVSVKEFSLSSGVAPIYSRRIIAKLLYVFKTLDEHHRRTKSDKKIWYELPCVMTGRWNCGDVDYLEDDLSYQQITLEHILDDDWDIMLNKDGVLDSKQFYDVVYKRGFDPEAFCADHDNVGLKKYLERVCSR